VLGLYKRRGPANLVGAGSANLVGARPVAPVGAEVGVSGGAGGKPPSLTSKMPHPLPHPSSGCCEASIVAHSKDSQRHG